MSHMRSRIRAELQAALLGSADAGDRVFCRRTLPLPGHLAPTLLLSFQNERSTDVSMDGTQERILEARITACTKGDADATEDLLDRLGLFVEGVFSADPQLGGLIATYSYQSTEYAFLGEAEKTVCVAAFTFALTYYTRRDHPETLL